AHGIKSLSGHGLRHLEQDDDIWFQAIRREERQCPDPFGAEVTPVTLVGDRRRHIAVTHDIAARIECWADHRRHVMSPVSSHEKGFGSEVQVTGSWIEEDLPKFPSDRRIARLE